MTSDKGRRNERGMGTVGKRRGYEGRCEQDGSRYCPTIGVSPVYSDLFIVVWLWHIKVKCVIAALAFTSSKNAYEFEHDYPVPLATLDAGLPDCSRILTFGQDSSLAGASCWSRGSSEACNMSIAKRFRFRSCSRNFATARRWYGVMEATNFSLAAMRREMASPTVTVLGSPMITSRSGGRWRNRWAAVRLSTESSPLGELLLTLVFTLPTPTPALVISAEDAGGGGKRGSGG
mmetsp:Transcript_707/g.1287  ORF Transcript_707/g.1287 Transcript_707/m.1287 type:complete len:233 (-) Transcript_707:641-1339(-)|eukprot:scaffold274176_cov31-Tisochrysis_lutea.AAC.3